MSRFKSAFWGSVSSQVFMIIYMLLAMGTTPLILKYLNKEEYGLSTVIFQIIGYLSMFDFGLGSAVGRYLAATRGDDEEAQMAMNRVISTSFFSYGLLGVVVCFIGIGFSPFVPAFFQMDARLSNVAINIVFTMSIFMGLDFPIRVFYSIFHAHQRQVLGNFTGFVVGILGLILPVVFLYFGYGLWSFAYSIIGCAVFSVTITFFLIRKYYPKLRIKRGYFDKSLVTQLFGFGFFLFLNAIAVQIIFQTDRFYIGSLVSLSAVTVYYITAKLPEISRNLVFKITDNVYPAMVEIVAKEGDNKFKLIHHKLLLITVSCIMVAFWMIFILDYWFLKLWVGENFFAGTEILVLTLIIMVQHSVLHVSFVCLNGAGIVKGLSVVSLVEAVLNLGLSIWLGKLYGIKGILIATIIAGALTTVWYTPYSLVKFTKIRLVDYLIKPVLFPIIIISCFGAILYWGSNQVLQTMEVNWLSFIGLGLVLGVLFGLFIWTVLLKKEFIEYVPVRFKKYLYV
jgi:O-antigen/teichoic acid export membrane protein